ncbi:MAG: oxidoreductase [Proteobacteria bacterium]|nr:oxidoreductase [Pseudomonadota bacterium]MDA1057168.1 oxidoreductase [Pseudomonadota bacterium]
MSDSFRAILASDVEGKAVAQMTDMSVADLPTEGVLIDVAFSALNYKDGLALNGNLGKVMRSLPMIPGIDLSGTVLESPDSRFRPGDEVLVTGWGLSETEWGGFGQRARVKADFLTKIPGGLDLKRAMAIGTAGFTAMLSVMALDDHQVTKDQSPVLVTGAAGGVGSVAVAVLVANGYRVAASTGRAETHDYLKSLGAEEIIERAELAQAGRPLDKERWAGVVDTVGSQTLATALAQVVRHGSVAACGLAGGSDLPTTVLPFILRGVNLLGIDSVYCPAERRERAWQRLAAELPREKLDAMTEVIPFDALIERSKLILKGQVRGRTVVDLRA